MDKDQNINSGSEKKDWLRAKAFAVVAFTFVAGYKIIVTPFTLTVDFPTLLSLLLAFFSVYLAALFYFKATDSSNAFYDNTYKFTQDIASLLVKIESGFGEKLRHIDEGYTSMRDKIDQLPLKQQVDKTESDIQKEKGDFEKTLAEKEKLIDELAQKAHLDETEKNAFKKKLNDKINELNKTQQQLEHLERRLNRYRASQNVIIGEHPDLREKDLLNLAGRVYLDDDDINRLISNEISIKNDNYARDLQKKRRAATKNNR